jgi:iron-sulfur cluster repair protein YtfE (RIC family)
MDASLAPYHQHHQELLRLANLYESNLNPAVVRNHPDLCLAEIQRLISVTKAHLAMETTVLYPALFSGRNEDVRAAAKVLESGLMDLSAQLRQYGHHWTSAETIRRAPEAFIDASLRLLGNVRLRIKAEATCLFPLVERA